ncbi:MAG TPA: ComF family protein [Woeseiaceae bacterium]|nr:ComF family protein [Woeseiaceae bacterium]
MLVGSFLASVLPRIACAALPRSCVLCGTRLAAGGLCGGCLADLPRIADACPRCAVPVPALPPGVPCGACQRRPPPFAAARAVLEYAFPVDAALKALKFHRRLHYAPAFAALLAPAARESFPAADALVPVPLHHARHAWRGFNQARELARPLARSLGLPLVGRVRRVRGTRPQAGLSARERRRNLAHAFAVTGRLPCRRPLIVDDVMTTGETCRRLAQALLAAGAEEVGVLVVARAVQPATGRNV